VVFTLPDSINVLPMQDPNWFMICYLSQLGNFEKFGKSQIKTGMIAVYRGQNLSLHPLHCIVPGGGVDKIAMEEYKGDGKFCLSQGVVQGFRAKYCGFTSEKPEIILESRNNLWRNSGSFCQKPLEVPISGGISGDTHKIIK
jgi:hypothetical protein